MKPDRRFVPTNKGTVEDQLEEIKEYLQVLSRKYSTTADESYKVIQELYRSLTEEREDYNNSELKRLWNQIEQRSSKSVIYSMSQEYLRKTDFGNYLENTSLTIYGTSVNITQLYEYSAGIDTLGDLTNARVNSHSNVITGLLYYDEDPITHQLIIPRYGVAVGEVTTITDSANHTVVDRGNLLGTFTGDELAFWKNGNKVLSLNATDGLTTEGIIKASGGYIGDLSIAQLPSGSVGLMWEDDTTPDPDQTIFGRDELYFQRMANHHFKVGQTSGGGLLFEVMIPQIAWLTMDPTNSGYLGGTWNMDVQVVGNSNTNLLDVLQDFEDRIRALGG